MKTKFQTLQPWLFQILGDLKKEIKAEHLSKSPVFYKTFFGNRPQNRLTTEEICAVYEKELLKGEDEELCEWIVNRWVFRNAEIYRHFAMHLEKINPEFSEIQALDEAQSEHILGGSLAAFGALPTYVFSVLNGVVFPENVMMRLRKIAETEETAKKASAAETLQKESLEQMAERHQAEIERLTRKYEDKLAGAAKKHATDVEALKKQVRALQQRVK